MGHKKVDQTQAVQAALSMVGFTETARGMRLGGYEIPKKQMKNFDVAARAIGGAAFRQSQPELRHALGLTGLALVECHSALLH